MTRRRPPRRPRQLHVAVVNLDKNKRGNRRYRWLVVLAMLQLIASAGGVGVICFVETKQGRRNVHLRGVGVRLRGRQWREVGNVGVHRDVEVAFLRLVRGLKVWLVGGHGPHRKSIADPTKDPDGQLGQDNYFRLLKDDVLDEYDPVLWLADNNNQPAYVASIVGGTPFGADGDVMGGTARGLELVDQWATDIGRDRRRPFTDHREAWATLRLAA